MLCEEARCSVVRPLKSPAEGTWLRAHARHAGHASHECQSCHSARAECSTATLQLSCGTALHVPRLPCCRGYRSILLPSSPRRSESPENHAEPRGARNGLASVVAAHQGGKAWRGGQIEQIELKSLMQVQCVMRRPTVVYYGVLYTLSGRVGVSVGVVAAAGT